MSVAPHLLEPDEKAYICSHCDSDDPIVENVRWVDGGYRVLIKCNVCLLTDKKQMTPDQYQELVKWHKTKVQGKQGVCKVVKPKKKPEAKLKISPEEVLRSCISLHICPICKSKMVNSVERIQVNDEVWNVLLFCPNCWEKREVYADRETVRELLKNTRLGSEALQRELDCLQKKNMEEDIEWYVTAIYTDRIQPIDFGVLSIEKTRDLLRTYKTERALDAQIIDFHNELASFNSGTPRVDPPNTEQGQALSRQRKQKRGMRGFFRKMKKWQENVLKGGDRPA